MCQHRQNFCQWRCLVLLAGALTLNGCAGAPGGSSTIASKRASSKGGIIPASSLKTGTFAADGHYKLSRQERSQSCKRIKGKMNVRIVQLQRTGILRSSSTMARKFSSMFSGGEHGLDGKTRRQRQRAVLVAYNKLLAKKKCPTVDLARELAPPTASPAAGGQNSGSRPQTR